MNIKTKKDSKPLYLGHRARVKKKFLTSLGKELHDYELLEILLFSAFARQDTKIIAKKLLEKFGNISAIINADIDQLRLIEQIGEGAVISIKVIAEIINRILKNQAQEKTVLSNWQALCQYIKNSLSNLDYEVFRVVFLNKNFQIIEDELLAIGQNDHVNISVKTITKKALIFNASALVLAHNHPSGELVASKHDIKTTNEIILALKPLDVKVLDHIIVAKNQVFSFKENMLL